ncbi:MAG: ATP citrate lyase citrate-binding domain-containing protein [bacterium]
MAQRAIRECHAKKLLATYLTEISGGKFAYEGKIVLVDGQTDFEAVKRDNPWLLTDKLVVKPDQLVGKRGKNNLLLLNATIDEAHAFISSNLNKEVTIGTTTGVLTHFAIEPFIPHQQEEEYYISITTERDKDVIAFSTQGGVEIEDNWEHVVKIPAPIGQELSVDSVRGYFPASLAEDRKQAVAEFTVVLYKLFADLGFTFIEVNPLVLTGGKFYPLDLKSRLDDTAAFEQAKKWGNLEFPAPFGQKLSAEEEAIKRLDEKSGSSLKLTVLNPKGRIWSLVAGGGASVVYADTIADLGFANDLANYGEYSGNPKTDETYEYTKTVLDLMTREKDVQGRSKVLLIGGGIANFTDVAKTFTGIIQALKDYRQKLIDTNVKIYVRRGGPNYQEGLKKMKKLGQELGVTIEVYGPETHMTKIVSMALAS